MSERLQVALSLGGGRLRLFSSPWGLADSGVVNVATNIRQSSAHDHDGMGDLRRQAVEGTGAPKPGALQG